MLTFVALLSGSVMMCFTACVEKPAASCKTVDSRRAAPTLHLREHIPLQRVALMLEVRERRADEYSDHGPAANLSLSIHRGQCSEVWFGQTVTWSGPPSTG